MPSRSESWGIEVGAQAVKAVHLGRSGGGIELLNFEVLPYKQILTAPDVNPEQLIQASLEQLIGKHEIGRTNTVVSVPGHLSFARFASLPPVDAKKLPQIVRYEAQQQIPFPIEEVEWDYKVFQEEDSPEIKAGIFAITKEQVLQYLANFRRLDIRVDEMTLSSLGVYNGLMFDDAVDPDGDGVIYVDVSTRSTDLIFVEGGAVWIRTLPIGGNAFTEAIARAFQISFTKAEQLKKEAATSKYARQISQAIRSDLANLQQEIQRSIGYYQSLNRDANITKIIGLGSTFRLPGLRTFLQKNLEMEVVKPDAFKEISMDGPRAGELSDSVINLATAYGLAVQGLGISAIDCNILPRFILTQRLWKAKQPWFAGAAACLAGAAGLVAFSHIKDNAAIGSGTTKVQQTERIISEAQGYQSELSSVQAEDKRPLINNFMRLVDYRDVYAKLYEDVLAAASVSASRRGGGVNDPKKDRFYLEWIDVAYAAKPVATDQAGGAGSSMDEMMMFDDFGGMGMGMGGGSGENAGVSTLFGSPLELTEFFPDAGLDVSSGEGVEPVDAASAPIRGPRLIVTVSMVVPQARADSKNFVSWLTANAERPNRPYRFVVDPSTALRFQKDLVYQDPTQIPGGSSPYGGGSPGSSPFGGDPFSGGFDDFGGGFDDFGGMGGMPQGMGGYSGGVSSYSGSLSKMLPVRPPEKDPTKMNEQSRRFVLQWEVELKPPAEARPDPRRTGPMASSEVTSNSSLEPAISDSAQQTAIKPKRVEDAS